MPITHYGKLEENKESNDSKSTYQKNKWFVHWSNKTDTEAVVDHVENAF